MAGTLREGTAVSALEALPSERLAEGADGRPRVPFRDDGIASDPVEYRAPRLHEASEGRYGVYLVRTLADGVEDTNIGVGTRIVLVKGRRSVGD